MPEPTVDPVEVLRQAAEVAPSVLPTYLADLVADELLAGVESVVVRGYGVSPAKLGVAREVLTLAEQQPSLVLAPAELTQEQVEEFTAKFEAAQQAVPKMTVLPHQTVSPEQLRYLLMDAYGLGRDDEEASEKCKGYDELHRALAADDEWSAQYLRAAGIEVTGG